MKSIIPILGLTALTSAQYYNISSEPFQLVLLSADDSINDTLSTCHTGAAIESLCLSNSNTPSKPDPQASATFTFNTSAYIPPSSDPSLGQAGILAWTLPTVQNDYPSSLTFNYDPTTNTAVPLLQPGDQGSQLLAFNAENELIVTGYVDWAADPPAAGNETAYKRWYACKTYFAGYRYENLVWGLGPEKPQNPTCVGVSVRRVFV